jgi:hypothetical protein
MGRDPSWHLSCRCRRLDLLLHRQVLRLRAGYQLSLDEFRGLYISDEQVDRLVSHAAVLAGRDDETIVALTHRAEALRVKLDRAEDPSHPWPRLAAAYRLGEFELDTLLLALAPQLDAKYETIYAYLNNDVTRKWPTRDLALRLFATHDVASRRRLLGLGGPLFQAGLLRPLAGHDPNAWLTAGFSIAPWVLPHLLGAPDVPGAASGAGALRPARATWDTLPLPRLDRDRLRALPRLFTSPSPDNPPPVLLLEGSQGSGRGAVAEAICHALRIPLVAVDVARCQAGAESVQALFQEVALYQRLVGAGLLLHRAEAVAGKDGPTWPEGTAALRYLESVTGPIMIACEPDAVVGEPVPARRVLAVRLHDPDFVTRLARWRALLSEGGQEAGEEAMAAVADRFALTPARIASAVAAVLDQNVLAGRDGAPLDEPALLEAARSIAKGTLGRTAVKVHSIHSWDDLVLPAPTLRQVKHIADAIRHRHVVYDTWGFGRRLSGGQGLKVLFAGSSGTGKTMTASVIAREVGLELYKVELSGVVSKYIGETEKNLDAVFRAAREANAMVFFDEADALFGKRSEVKDAHDRYANIEVAYLLQKMEEHDGVVVLATNLSRNLDQAFSRRMQYVVEFPMPNAAQRKRLWGQMFPGGVPLADDVDFDFLAEQFTLSGGDVRNVALDAAFLAASDGRVVTMSHLIGAVARQLLKQGKSPAPADFKQYHGLLASDPEFATPAGGNGRG